MAKNVMKMLKPSPKRGKNAFDLSHRHILGARFGELLPITCLETVPGDYFEINCADLLRAMPMVTSPFMRAKQHIDFWFVPYTDLWHNFNQFIASKGEPQSAALKDALYVPHCSVDLMGSVASTDVSGAALDVVGQTYSDGASKLMDLLGYGLPTSYIVEEEPQQPDVNLWRLAAYNYIWYHEYRQNYYDDGSRFVGDSPAYLFNFDDLKCDSYADADIVEGGITAEVRLRAMLQMRYRCWKKDLYTGLMPSTQFGDVSAVDIHSNALGVLSAFAIGNSKFTGSTRQVGLDGKYLEGYNDTETLQLLGPSKYNWFMEKSDGERVGLLGLPESRTMQMGFDILALRNAQAIQIWRENALRAGNRVSDNFEAHFGEKPSYQRDHRPTYIGSYDAVLNISDVNATAQVGSGGNQSLGDVAGKGLSSLDSKTLKFQTNDFGVIIGMFSILPEAEYNANGIERTNQLLDRFDYFAPEMENLGLEAVSSQNFIKSQKYLSSILGYAPRYYAYKTKLDKVFGSFKTNGDLQIWCSPKYDVEQGTPETPYALTLKSLYVNPSVFDVNFVADADTLGVQFLCDFFFDVSAVRAMTVLGMPTA